MAGPRVNRNGVPAPVDCPMCGQSVAGEHECHDAVENYCGAGSPHDRATTSLELRAAVAARFERGQVAMRERIVAKLIELDTPYRLFFTQEAVKAIRGLASDPEVAVGLEVEGLPDAG